MRFISLTFLFVALLVCANSCHAKTKTSLGDRVVAGAHRAARAVREAVQDVRDEYEQFTDELSREWRLFREGLGQDIGKLTKTAKESLLTGALEAYGRNMKKAISRAVKKLEADASDKRIKRETNKVKAQVDAAGTFLDAAYKLANSLKWDASKRYKTLTPRYTLQKLAGWVLPMVVPRENLKGPARKLWGDGSEDEGNRRLRRRSLSEKFGLSRYLADQLLKLVDLAKNVLDETPYPEELKQDAFDTLKIKRSPVAPAA